MGFYSDFQAVKALCIELMNNSYHVQTGGSTCSTIKAIRLNYLQQVFAIQVPLLDAIVAGAAEEHVALDHQRLDAVVVRRLKVVGGSHASQGAFVDIK